MRTAAPLGVLVISGSYDRIHYALATAAAALALDRPTTVFFANAAPRALLAADDDGEPAFAALPVSPELAGLVGSSGAAMARWQRARGIADLAQLIEACASLDGRLVVCDMALRLLDAKAQHLRSDVRIEVGGLVAFLATPMERVTI